MIKVCSFNKSNDVTRFDIFKKLFECYQPWPKDHELKSGIALNPMIGNVRANFNPFFSLPLHFFHFYCRCFLIFLYLVQPTI